MQADGFLNQKQRHPLALTAAIAINLAGVTAVMLVKNGYVPKPPPTGIPIIDLFDPPPPDPIKPDQPKVKQSQKPIYTPPPKVPAGGTAEGAKVTGTTEYPPSGNGAGSGEGTITPPRADPIPVPVLTDPVPLAGGRDFQPAYPPQLLRTGVEGNVVVRVQVGADGRVKQVAILSADDPLFADATERQALRKWRFRPATRDGAPIESWKQMTVRFQITT